MLQENLEFLFPRILKLWRTDTPSLSSYSNRKILEIFVEIKYWVKEVADILNQNNT